MFLRAALANVETCDRCGARMRLRATRFVISDGGLVTAAASIERCLRHLGEPTEPAPLSRARGSPFFKSRVVRRKFGELDSSIGSSADASMASQFRCVRIRRRASRASRELGRELSDLRAEDAAPSGGSGGSASGDSSGSGASASGGASGSAGASGNSGAGADSDDDGGCGCRSAKRRPSSPLLFGAVLLGLAALRRGSAARAFQRRLQDR